MIFSYFYWHYFIAPGELVKIARNYFAGVWHMFLIGRHAQTLFAPWHRMQFSTEHAGLTDRIGSAIADTYFRFVAGIVRLCIVVAGLIAEVFMAVVFVAIGVAWMVWPAILFVAITNIFSII